MQGFRITVVASERSVPRSARLHTGARSATTTLHLRTTLMKLGLVSVSLAWVAVLFS